MQKLHKTVRIKIDRKSGILKELHKKFSDSKKKVKVGSKKSLETRKFGRKILCRQIELDF